MHRRSLTSHRLESRGIERTSAETYLMAGEGSTQQISRDTNNLENVGQIANRRSPVLQTSPETRAFLDSHRWAVLTVLRDSGAPVSSMVAYVCDGDDVLVSTPGPSFKARCIERDARVNLCAVSNNEPFSFVAIEGAARIETQDLKAQTLKIFDAIADTNFQPPPDLDAWLHAQQRVILRITPERVTAELR